MNKILKALLETKFPTANVNAFLEVIGATPNPELATEILCGLYEEAVIKHKFTLVKGNIYSFVSYNKWNDKVTYSYDEPETRGGYFPENINKEDVTIDNFDKLKSSKSTNNYWYIPTGKMVKRTSEVYLETWNNYEPLVEEVML